jgi:type IV pilus assembly protein PilV
MHAPFTKCHAGFSLIESLVALLVISVGMIGIAALYTQGLSGSRTALFRTQAVTLAADMADRIRANRTAGVAYEDAEDDNDCDAGDDNDCTTEEMAAHDLWLWEAQVAAQLPNGVGVVAVDTTDPPTYTIRITWQDVGAGASYEIAIQVPEV